MSEIKGVLDCWRQIRPYQGVGLEVPVEAILLCRIR